MSIGKYRSRRNRAIPAAATIGAPLRGVFSLGDLLKSGASGNARVSAVAMAENGETTYTEVWTPLKSLDTGSVVVSYLGVDVPVSEVITSGGGDSLEISYAPQAGDPTIWVRPGHPALVAANGAVCGGALY